MNILELADTFLLRGNRFSLGELFSPLTPATNYDCEGNCPVPPIHCQPPTDLKSFMHYNCPDDHIPFKESLSNSANYDCEDCGWERHCTH